MTHLPRTGLRRLWYVASWRARYWWMDTRAGVAAQLLATLAFGGVACWSLWQSWTVGVAVEAGRIPVNQAIAQWAVYAIMFIVSALISLALAPKIRGTEAQKVEVPIVEDGAVIRRIYGPVWIKDPIMLAFKPNGTTEIKKKAGKSWKLKTKWQVVGHHYAHFFQFGLCRGVLDAVMAIRAADKEAWTGQLTSSGIVSINKPNLWGGEDAEGGMVGDFEVAFGNPDQLPSAYLAANIAPEQSAYRWRPYATWRGGRWGNSPYPKAPAFLVSRILQGWDGQDCWYPEKAAVPVVDAYLQMLGDGWEYVIQTFAEPNSGWNDFTVPTSGWQQGGELPFATADTWSPMRSNIWLRRKIHVNALGLTLNIGADNGCVVWVDGVEIGSSNPTNIPITSNQNNPVSFTFSAVGIVEVVVKAFAEISAGADSGNVVDLSFTGAPLLGMNIAHALYDSLTAREMDGEPRALVNDANWRAAADRLYGEGFGIGTEFIAGAETIEQYQQRLCDLAGARMSTDPTTGEWHLDLIRGDVPDDILVLTDDDVLEFEEQPGLLDEAVNQVTARWTDVLKDEIRATAPLQALGAIQSFGSVNAEKLECPEVLSESLALRLAARNLDARATPLKRHSLKVTRVAYRVRPGQKVRLQLPKRAINDMVVVLGDVSRGTLRSGAIALTTVQDVVSMPDTTYVIGEPGTAPTTPTTALPAPAQAAFELPYRDLTEILTEADLAYLAPSASYVGMVAQRPAGAMDYLLHTRVGAGELEEATSGSWCPTALVVEASALDDPDGGLLRTEFTLVGGAALSEVVVGSGALWGAEMVRVDALDLVTGAVTLARGCGDTVPQAHAAGERLWFYDADTAIDPEERATGDVIGARVLTRTGSDVLDPASAPESTVVVGGRPARPYPPAAVRINGTLYPDSVLFGAVAVSWASRNRITQAEQLVDWMAPAIPAEAGASCTLNVYPDGSSSPVHTAAGLTGSSVTWTPAAEGRYRLELLAQRAGLASWQAYSHTLDVGGALWTLASLSIPPQLWFSDDSPITEDSGGVSQWGDISGHGYHAAQSVAARRPVLVPDLLNGRRGLRFDGSDDRLLGPASGPAVQLLSGASEAWGLAVYRSSSVASSARNLFGITHTSSNLARFLMAPSRIAGGAMINYPGVGGRSQVTDSYSHIYSATHAGTDWVIVLARVRYTSAQAVLNVNGGADEVGALTSMTAAASQAVNQQPFAIGKDADGTTSGHFMGDLVEHAFGVGALTNDDVERIAGYIAHKWGLVDRLPVDHPYKTAPPVVD
ncbi:phage tail protein [Xanthomonas sp. XNM01]|uniref:phage tail protein n=1 Tax=Xanthomonas sp. XNM01 TaxID=2769289 RepID=UPI00177C2B59|nr:phage tail protein [Xanthomonas sp. XNM01]MBD9368863.1 hypothetical protein [Xanthomonas sp. XNM01]